MNVLYVSPSFFPAYVYGGPTESGYQLCRHLDRNGCTVRVLTTDANGLNRVLEVEKDQEVVIADGLPVRYCRRRLCHSVSPMLLRYLPPYIRWADVVHLAAVYSFPTIPALIACKMLSKPMVWSPHGALQRWEGSTRLTLKKQWERICRVVAPKRLVLHVTCGREVEESQGSFPGVPIAMIPHGVVIPNRLTPVPGNGMVRLLYLGRLHSKKGIENLLAACQRLRSSSGVVFSLSVAGSGDPPYTETLRILIAKLGLSPHVKMVGEVMGEGKQQLLEHTDIVVVPSYTENFGMVVAEALAHGVPVIASRGTPWRRLEEMRCGLWVDHDPHSLAQAIERMSEMPLGEMGQRGRRWIQKEFSWDGRASEMINIYSTLLKRSS